MKRTWLILLGWLIFAAPAAVQAQVLSGSNFDYIINASNANTITITNYFGVNTVVAIPTNINGLTVTGIGDGEDSVFTNHLTSVTIPNTVTSIGDSAFDYCYHLTSIMIGTNVTSIGDYAFDNTSLTSVTIPNSVTSIGQYAFDDSSLISVTLGNSIINIEDGAFSGTSLTSVTIPGSVTSIGDSAFSYCASLTTITVAAQNVFYSSTNGILFNTSQTTLVAYPGGLSGSYAISNGVSSIGGGAFGGASLTSVTIPDSVTNIGDYEFSYSTSLTTITVSAQNMFYGSTNGILFSKSQTTLVAYPGGLSGSYTIPNGVTNIGNGAFGGANLTSVIIPNGVTTIGDNAFDSTSLASVNIPNSVTSIGQYAFDDPSLNNVTIGDSVTSIGDYAFDSATLTSVTIPNSVTSIGQYAFDDPSLTSVTLGDSITNIEDGAFSGASLTSITIPNSVTSIGQYAFDNPSLTSVTLGNSIINIGEGAFSGARLISVIIPGSVTSIGDYTFSGCTSLTGIYFQGNAPTADSTVFSGDNGIVYYLEGTTGWGSVYGGLPAMPLPYNFSTNAGAINITGYTGPGGAVIIPATIAGLVVTSIGTNAFANLASLTSILIPGSVISIGNDAFIDCTNLTSVYFQGNAPTANATVFSNDHNATVYYYPGTTGWNSTFAGLPASNNSVIAAAAQSIYAEAYTFTTFAGQASSGSADGTGTDALFDGPEGVAVDRAGNVYVADYGNSTIRKITPEGEVSTIAGFAGSFGYVDGTNSAARFYHPTSVAVDGAGKLYVADVANNVIRMITPIGSNWVVSTIAGHVTNSGSYADGMGTNAYFSGPQCVAADIAGNLYVADANNDAIRKIALIGTNWIVSTIAGNTSITNNSGKIVGGYADGTGSTARFHHPLGVTADSAGNVYVADSGNSVIRMITPAGTNWVVSTLAGMAGITGTNDGTGTNAQFSDPFYLAVDSATNLYVADTDNETIRIIMPSGTNWEVSVFAGEPGFNSSSDGTGTNAAFSGPVGVAVDTNGNVYIGDYFNNAIRMITSAAVVSTIAGAGLISQNFTDGTGSEAHFFFPSDVVVDRAGNVYVADTDNGTIRKITPLAVSTTIAGCSYCSVGSSNGAGTEALFNYPYGLAVDGAGNVFVADTDNQLIREITQAGVVSTIAGSTTNSGDADGAGSEAQFNYPSGVAVDSAGNLYVADTDNNTIRLITPSGSNWVVSTIAGCASCNFGYADGTGTNALFNEPSDIVVDSATNLYVADSANNTIRLITPSGSNWVVSTIAGQAANSAGLADGTGTNALFNYPEGLAVDGASNLYVADTDNNAIRKIKPAGTNWVVITIGGNGTVTNIGKIVGGSTDGAGSTASFDSPAGIAVDSAGNVYVADTDNDTIRKGVFTPYIAANVASYVQPSTSGSGQIMVTLLPPEANGQWRFPWELGWRNSGTAVMNLVEGEYPIEFRDVPGYLIIPLANPVSLASGGMAVVTNQYYPTAFSGNTNIGGSLTVNIGPSPPSGAGWGFLGNTPPFFPPGFGTNLMAGTYLITFAPAAGFATPPNLSVQVVAQQSVVLTETYLLAQSPPDGVLLPVPVPSTDILDLTDYPYGFNGQLETDVGYGSGVAVQTNVVLTAAHLVFNDQTLSYVSQAYWFFQEESGVSAPDPMQARGWYLLSGYAAQRTNDVLGGLGPDQSSPQSRNLDVAALYFTSPVAGGGYGGYLPSDATTNTWLTSTAEKMLVGYPVDGSLFGDASIVNGEMYEIGPQPYPLTQATDPVKDQQVYTASWFLSYPGNSGGPFYVEFGGYYYPAGVYLGTLFNGTAPYASAVRAIDSDVTNLIYLAATEGDNGTNNSGGGVVTIVPIGVNANNPGYVQIQLGPPAAVQAGARWLLQGGTYGSDSVAPVYSTNASIGFASVIGYSLPTNRTITVVSGRIVTNIALYTALNETVSLSASPTNGGTVNVDGTNGGGIFPYGSSQTVTATASNGFEFIGWSGDATGTNNPLMVMMNTNLYITANFTNIPPTNNEIIFLSAFPTNGGAVGGGGTFPQGSSRMVTATASNGFLFIGWTGDATGTNNPLLVAVNTNLDITANFATNTTNITVTVIINDSAFGAVSPNLNRKNLKAGRSYILTATATSGNVFSSWTGSITTNKNPLTIKPESSLVLQANFMPNPFLPAKGTYNGLFTNTNGVTEQTAGMLKDLIIGTNGAYSGLLLINGASHAIHGSFNLAGQAMTNVSRGENQGGPLAIAMTLLTESNSAPQVTGTVSGTNSDVSWVAALTADRATNKLRSAEYTMLILPDTNSAPTNSPGGAGYALITNHAGTATITGALADGAAFSQSVPVSQSGCLPLYASLYKNKGLLLGWINLDPSNIDGASLTWVHPTNHSGLFTNAFTSTNPAALSPWTNPPPGSLLANLTNLSFLDIINDTNVLMDFTVAIGSNFKLDEVSGPADVTLSGSLAPKTGLLKVSIGTGANKKTGYGAILPNETSGGGFFLTTNAQAIQLGP